MVADLVDVRVRQFEAGGIDAPSIAEIHEPSGFVDREDRPDAISDARRNVAGIIAERFRRFAGSPAADLVLERLRQIPVIERRVWLDAVLEQFVDEAVVEVEALGVRLARSFRKHPRPRDRKPVGLGAQFADQADVFLVAVVVFVGAIAGGAVLDLARRVRERIPDRAAAAVFVHRALDLIGRGGGAPHEVLSENSQALAARLLLARRRRPAPPRCRARTSLRALQNAGARIFRTSSSPVSVRRSGRRISCRSRRRRSRAIRRRRTPRPRKSSSPSRG